MSYDSAGGISENSQYCVKLMRAQITIVDVYICHVYPLQRLTNFENWFCLMDGNFHSPEYSRDILITEITFDSTDTGFRRRIREAGGRGFFIH